MTPMTDKDTFAAYTQRHITMLLLWGIMLLIVGLLIASFLPYQANDKILSLVSPLLVGIFGLASGACGFWIGRQRPQTQLDPSTTTIETHSTTTPTPTVVPVGKELVGAPPPPAAIITPPAPSPGAIP